MPEKGPLRNDDALRQEIRTLRARFTKMSEVDCRITEIWDLDVVLQEIVDGARSLTTPSMARSGCSTTLDDLGSSSRLASLPKNAVCWETRLKG